MSFTISSHSHPTRSQGQCMSSHLGSTNQAPEVTKPPEAKDSVPSPFQRRCCTGAFLHHLQPTFSCDKTAVAKSYAYAETSIGFAIIGKQAHGAASGDESGSVQEG